MVCKHIGLYLLTFGCCFIWKHFYLLFIIICIFKLKKRNYICHAFSQLNIWFFLIQFILPGAGNCKPNEEIQTPPLKKKTSPKIQPQNSSGLSRKNPPWCYCLVKVVDTHKSVWLFIGDKTICPRPYISGQLKPLQKWFSNFDWILWVEREREVTRCHRGVGSRLESNLSCHEACGALGEGSPSGFIPWSSSLSSSCGGRGGCGPESDSPQHQ